MDVTGATIRRCTGCGAALLEDDCFCEQCGARATIDLHRGSSADDRVETDLVVAAAISDRGRVHRRNEDAFRIDVVDEHAAIAVVCDGISSASAGNAAARSAADAAATTLSEAVSGHACDG